MTQMIIDAHQDLAYNMLTYGRDYRRPVAETRALEVARPDTIQQTGHALIGWPEFQRGQVALVIATIFAAPERYKGGSWENVYYRSYAEAAHLYRQQFSIYERLAGEDPDKFHLVKNRRDLAEVLAPWQQQPAVWPGRRPEEEGEQPAAVTHPVGLVLLLEGAEGLQHPEELEEYWEMGLRLVGPVWAGDSGLAGGQRFGGSYVPGGMTSAGRELLEVMAGLGYILDIAHMTEAAALAAIDFYDGPVIASHANARALLHGDETERHLTDQTIRSLVERDGIIGVVPFNRFLRPGWRTGDDRGLVTLATLASHIDHICQIAGDSLHAGLGTDFDGGFGWPAVPAEVNDISDLQKLAPVLQERGFADEDIVNIMGGNWRRLLERTLPER